MSVTEFDKGEEDMIYILTQDVITSIINVYHYSYDDVSKKVAAELEELHFDSNEKLLDFLGLQINEYNLLFTRLCDECVKLIIRFGLSSEYMYSTHCLIKFRYNSKTRDFVFYRYLTDEVYEKIKLEAFCEKLDSKKFLVF